MSEISNNSFLKLLINSGISFFLKNEPNNFYKNKTIENKEKLFNDVDEIVTLKDLEIFIKNSSNCKLKELSNSTVFSDGNAKSKIMLIGEAPGAEEDKLGKPFVGAAGQLLNKMLSAINLNRKDVYITNVVPWRPPNNRTPTNDEIIQCLPFIQRHIEIVSPKFILLLGATAAKSILNTNLSITKLRNKWHEYKTINNNKIFECLVTYHPAFLLRSPQNKKESWDDLKKLKMRITNENL